MPKRKANRAPNQGTDNTEIQALSQYDEVELDALYVGVDKTGTLFVLPIEAKSQAENEMIGRIQVSQMAKLVRQDFAELRRRILAVKALADGTIAMVEFDDHEEPDDFGIVSVSRFHLIRRGATD